MDGNSGAWSGWIAFAGLLMVVIGSLDFFAGLVAIINDRYYTVTRDQMVLIHDVSHWGWVTLLWGIRHRPRGLRPPGRFDLGALVRDRGRDDHVFGGILGFVGNSAYPLWTLIVLALNGIVLYALDGPLERCQGEPRGKLTVTDPSQKGSRHGWEQWGLVRLDRFRRAAHDRDRLAGLLRRARRDHQQPLCGGHEGPDGPVPQHQHLGLARASLGVVIVLLAGFGLLAGSGWARWFAIVVGVVTFFANLGWVGNSAYPLWTLTVLFLNGVVLYALMVRWNEATGPPPGAS